MKDVNSFKNNKPKEFILCDKYVLKNVRKEDKHYYINIIQLADNRMQTDDFIYIEFKKNNCIKCDVLKEFYRYLFLAYNTKNLEYVIYSYNMFRIEFFKNKTFENLTHEKHIIFFYLRYAVKEEWSLISKT